MANMRTLPSAKAANTTGTTNASMAARLTALAITNAARRQAVQTGVGLRKPARVNTAAPARCVPTSPGPSQIKLTVVPGTFRMLSPKSELKREKEGYGGDVDIQKDPVITNERVNTAIVFNQKRGDDEGKSPVHDDHAVAQRIEAVGANER